MASGRAQVRKVALRVMAERFDASDAVGRARDDPDASIWCWAPKLAAQADPTPTTLF